MPQGKRRIGGSIHIVQNAPQNACAQIVVHGRLFGTVAAAEAGQVDGIDHAAGTGQGDGTGTVPSGRRVGLRGAWGRIERRRKVEASLQILRKERKMIIRVVLNLKIIGMGWGSEAWKKERLIGIIVQQVHSRWSGALFT